MMRRKKIRRSHTGVYQRQESALLWVILLCAVYLLYSPLLYGSSTDLYNSVLALQFPFLHSYAPQEEEENPPPPVEADLDEGVGAIFRIELDSIRHTEKLDLPSSEPSILIYHTHTTEAYTQSSAMQYEESGDWRTHDNDKNIVAVGERLARLLRERYGLNVIHDITDHEPPKLSTSYSRSVKTMQSYKERYPSISMFIDVHRDAYGTEDGKKDYLVIDGKETARMMFVVGTGEGATGSGFGEMPDFESNYALAAAISTRLRKIDHSLARDIRVKTGRYNQHISSQCLLVEVGHNMNTLEQALNATDHLAAAIAGVAGKSAVESDGLMRE